MAAPRLGPFQGFPSALGTCLIPASVGRTSQKYRMPKGPRSRMSEPQKLHHVLTSPWEPFQMTWKVWKGPSRRSLGPRSSAGMRSVQVGVPSVSCS